MKKAKNSFWDNFIGPDHQTPVFYQKELINVKGWAIKLHCMVRADNPEQYHTHTGYYFRIVLWGGYVEETYFGTPWRKHFWFPGRMGFMKPSFCHRIHSMMFAKKSYSLIFRSPRCAKVRLVGAGWPVEND